MFGRVRSCPVSYSRSSVPRFRAASNTSRSCGETSRASRSEAPVGHGFDGRVHRKQGQLVPPVRPRCEGSITSIVGIYMSCTIYRSVEMWYCGIFVGWKLEKSVLRSGWFSVGMMFCLAEEGSFGGCFACAKRISTAQDAPGPRQGGGHPPFFRVSLVYRVCVSRVWTSDHLVLSWSIAALLRGGFNQASRAILQGNAFIILNASVWGVGDPTCPAR